MFILNIYRESEISQYSDFVFIHGYQADIIPFLIYKYGYIW